MNVIELLFKTEAEKKFQAQFDVFNSKRWETLSDLSSIRIDDDAYSYMLDQVKGRSFLKRWSNVRVGLFYIIAIVLSFAPVMFPNSTLAVVAWLAAMGIIVFSDRKNHKKEIFLRRKELIPLALKWSIQTQSVLKKEIAELAAFTDKIKKGDLEFIVEQLKNNRDTAPFLDIINEGQILEFWGKVKETKVVYPTMQQFAYERLLERLDEETNYLNEFKV